jgi:hypothetical protein
LSSLSEIELFSIQVKKSLASILLESRLSGKPWSGEGFLGILPGSEYRIGRGCVVVAFLI